MQDQTVDIDVTVVKEKLLAAVSRLERSVLAMHWRRSIEAKTCRQVVEELDTHIANLEILLNVKKK